MGNGGSGSTNKIKVLDECTNIDPEILDSLFPIIGGVNKKVIITSTPRGFNVWNELWENSQKIKDQNSPKK